ncbi:hypothetical protein AMTR_s00031p00171310 [Amborella trichopoda]|uniref:Uncharacterized protein n=1 Tax=Amborella trichopoda TaxID=13333 RepID=U5D2W8_AMBTC|nr:hypothetical protein AMTR_s00031p00171310 [Amborella trichopoda]
MAVKAKGGDGYSYEAGESYSPWRATWEVFFGSGDGEGRDHVRREIIAAYMKRRASCLNLKGHMRSVRKKRWCGLTQAKRKG